MEVEAPCTGRQARAREPRVVRRAGSWRLRLARAEAPKAPASGRLPKPYFGRPAEKLSQSYHFPPSPRLSLCESSARTPSVCRVIGLQACPREAALTLARELP